VTDFVEMSREKPRRAFNNVSPLYNSIDINMQDLPLVDCHHSYLKTEADQTNALVLEAAKKKVEEPKSCESDVLGVYSKSSIMSRIMTVLTRLLTSIRFQLQLYHCNQAPLAPRWHTLQLA